MIRTKGIYVALGALMVSSAAHAADQLMFAGIGSSAMYNSFFAGAKTAAGGAFIDNVAGANRGSFNAGITGTAVDTSSAGIPTVTASAGNVSIVWKGTAGNLQIWVYYSVDSTVGVRCFFNQAKIGTITAASGLLSTDSAIDTEIKTFLAGQTFNAGMTDVTPLDALVATNSAISAYGSNFATNHIFGRNSSSPVTPSTSTSSTFVQPVAFNLSSRAFTLNSIGAVPVVVFVNKTDALAGGFGALNDNNHRNVQLTVLSNFLNGQFTRTDSLAATFSTAVSKPVATFVREPLSGTYLTTEFCGPRSLRSQTSQEDNVSATYLNDANLDAAGTTFTSEGRVRVIGTGAMQANVARTPNSLGYSFWSLGNFTNNSSVAANTYSLTVDGLDPVQDSYSGGTYPSSSGVTFRNVINGSYPLWSVIRCVTDKTTPQSVQDTITGALAAQSGGNFVPKNQLLVFRSHRSVLGSDVSNGNNGIAEAGSDAGGLVLPISADKQFSLATGGFELTGLGQ